MTKCEYCGNKLEYLKVNSFLYDGTDIDTIANLMETNVDSDDTVTAVYLDTTQNWTGYDLPNEERINTICCPYCMKYPFKDKDLYVLDVVRVIMFKSNGEQ